MGKNTRILAFSSMILLAVVFMGCKDPIEPVSSSERMAMFKADIDASNWSSIREHTHPDAAAYNTAYLSGVTNIWDTFFGSGIGAVSVSSNTATITTPANYTFHLKEDDTDVYKIYLIVNDDTDVTIFN